MLITAPASWGTYQSSHNVPMEMTQSSFSSRAIEPAAQTGKVC